MKTSALGAIELGSMFAAVGVPRPTPSLAANSPLVPKSIDPCDGCTVAAQVCAP